MFHYEIQLRQAELIREAETERLARQVRKARGAARRRAKDAEGRVSSADDRFTRAA
ncbi:hypothetical protein J7E87_11290 [Streptomyces sp. ISL-1]|uniref:hypothetical protein n=1 Tax=Streptomyces sp. ISL-1 TaxID=2817657 RepID=UPI001BE5B0F4|nr:hypothetical protein [Streptomyces sp. ISL-1]MBT2389990.1 hypothetical protein [Streptomyces sp. ISL-1]